MTRSSKRWLMPAAMLAVVGSVCVTTPALAVQSVQKFSFAATPASGSAPATPNALVGSGTARLIGLGLDEVVTLKLFATPAGAGGATILVTGDSPLIIREVIPVTLTPVSSDPQYGTKISFSIPRNLQSPAPGVIAAMKDLQITMGDFASSGGQDVPLAMTTGCAGGWPAKVTADYTTSFDSAIESTQTASTQQPCPAVTSGPVSLSLHPYFDSVSPDLDNQVQFATVNVSVFLSKQITTNFSVFTGCSLATVFQDEHQCAGGGAGGGTYGPAGPAGPAGPVGTVGAPGPPGRDGKDGQLVLVAYQARVSARKVTVSYALTGPASVTLLVGPSGRNAVKVATARGKAGLNTISWNRKLGGKRARKGSYRLSLTAADAAAAAASRISVRLR